MTVREAVRNEQDSVSRPLKLLASRRMPENILVIVTEGYNYVEDIKKWLREVRCVAYCGEQRIYSAIAKTEWLDNDH